MLCYTNTPTHTTDYAHLTPIVTLFIKTKQRQTEVHFCLALSDILQRNVTSDDRVFHRPWEKLGKQAQFSLGESICTVSTGNTIVIPT